MSAAAIGLSIGGVCLASLGIMAWFALRAPFGFESEDGFHYDDPASWGDQ